VAQEDGSEYQGVGNSDLLIERRIRLQLNRGRTEEAPLTCGRLRVILLCPLPAAGPFLYSCSRPSFPYLTCHIF
jgi:hypothetical protein